MAITSVWSGSGSASLEQPRRDNAAPLVWLNGVGAPNPEAHQALDLLGHAADDALDPSDYGVQRLVGQAAKLATGPQQDAAAERDFDGALTAAMGRYLHDLHSGRVDPRIAGFDLDIPPDDHDFTAIVREAAAQHRIRETATEFTPALALYRALRGALARYRRLAADVSLAPPAPTKVVVRPGDAYPAVEALRRLLAAVGDLPATEQAMRPGIHDPPTVRAIRRFQTRHGLVPDGVIGKDTQAALQVPLNVRVQQVELAMERLRWLPHLGDERFIGVNIPMFRLWAWDTIPPDGAPTFDTAVIVGRALRTQTPVFVEEMRSVIFRPYWNIPPSILRGEILPALRHDPNYLRRQNMEIVSGDGDDAAEVGLTPQVLDQLDRGILRVRQRPGAGNALGLVKFVFPNDDNVYMHDTPAPQLFDKTRRDFSHGCIRVQDPVALAQWALKDRPEWTLDRILAAMRGEESIRVDLPRPIRVILFYVTAVVMPEDEAVYFAEDIYGHDTRLVRALAARTR